MGDTEDKTVAIFWPWETGHKANFSYYLSIKYLSQTIIVVLRNRSLEWSKEVEEGRISEGLLIDFWWCWCCVHERDPGRACVGAIKRDQVRLLEEVGKVSSVLR